MSLCKLYSINSVFLSLLFTVKAFHVKFEEVKLDSNIQKWDVEVLQVSNLYCICSSCSPFICPSIDLFVCPFLHLSIQTHSCINN